ncbi:MAG: hypothetical protein IKI53_03055, partial [Firmicutes bacterium]|nr:hypothetical protein [Bacillota bacterium]
PKLLSQIVSGSEQRFFTGLGELDRVLGGGAVKGSLVLVENPCAAQGFFFYSRVILPIVPARNSSITVRAVRS